MKNTSRLLYIIFRERAEYLKKWNISKEQFQLLEKFKPKKLLQKLTMEVQEPILLESSFDCSHLDL